MGEYAFALRSHGYFIRESRVSAAASLAYLLLNSWVASHLKSLLAETPPPTLHVPAPWLPIMPKLVFPKPTPPPSPSALYRRRASWRWSGGKPPLCGFGTNSVFLTLASSFLAAPALVSLVFFPLASSSPLRFCSRWLSRWRWRSRSFANKQQPVLIFLVFDTARWLVALLRV